MSLRSHSVVVEPQHWSGAPEELARLLAPIAGARPDSLAELLGRGPMTIDADLSSEDAEALRSRLVQLGIPAIIVPDDADFDGESVPQMPGMGAADEERVTDEIDRAKPRRSTMLGMKPVGEDAGGSGWGALFPDLADDGPSQQPAEPEEQLPPSLDELSGALDEPADSDEVEEKPAPSGPSTLPSAPGAAEAPAPKLPSSKPTEPPKPTHPSKPARPPVSSNAADQADEADQTPKPPPSRGFNPAKLSPLLPKAESERAPYAPNGFDPRPEHHPPFALAFGIAAPGAGQVFNGDDDDALHYGLRFWMIKPWYDAAKGAFERAEKIRTYYAPRPEEGNMIRAVRYTVAWWICAVLAGILLYWGGSKAVELLLREPVPDGPTPQQIATTFSDAETKVLGARVAALDALKEANEAIELRGRFSMSLDERVERLYVLGFEECVGKRYSMCEQMMKRVTELKGGYKSAIQLQAWASLQQRGGQQPMPEVDDVKSIDEYELELYRQQMALEGEDVPPPPEEDSRKPPGDAPLPDAPRDDG